MWDAAERGRQVLANMLRVTEDRVRGAHDAQFVIDSGRAYIIYEANDVRAGENGEWPFVYSALSVVDIREKRLVRVQEAARGEQVFDNVTLKPGACFVPRILKKDDRTLRVFFHSMEPGVRQAESWYVDYDMETGCFDTKAYPLMLETPDGIAQMTPGHFHAFAVRDGFAKPEKDSGLYITDADKPIGGKRYVGLNNWLSKQNALGVFNDSLDCIRVLGNCNEPQSADLSEAAFHVMPDGRWVAILRNDNGNRNSMFATSDDGEHWSVAEEWSLVQNGSNSKPTLDCFGGVYFLGWQEKPFRTRFNIDVSTDFVHWNRAVSFDDPSFCLQYPHLAEADGEVYISGTHGSIDPVNPPGPDGRDSIYFGRLMSLEEARGLCRD